MRFRRRARRSQHVRLEVDGSLTATLDEAPVMVRATGPDPVDCVWCNRTWLRFRGRTLAEELGSGWTEGIHPTDVERVLDGYRRAAEAGAAFATEYDLRGVDGRYRTVAERGHPVVDDAGTLRSFLISAHDVTDQRTVRASLEQRTQQRAAIADLGRAALAGRDFRDLAADAARLVSDALAIEMTAVLELTPDGELQTVAARGQRRMRMPRTAVDDEQLALARDAIMLVEPVVVEDWIKHRRSESGEPEGARKVRSSCCAPIRTPAGPVGVLAAHSPHPGDFTSDDVNFLRSVANVLGAALARQRVEHELRTSETHLRLALESGRMGMWEWDPAANSVRWSPELEALFGVRVGSFPGTLEAYMEHVHPEDRELVAKVIRTAVEDDAQIAMEHRILMPDGTVRWVEGRGSKVVDAPSPRWIGVAIDVHERKTVEQERERLLESEQGIRLALEETVARLDTLLEHSPFAFAFFDSELRFVRVNTQFASVTGLSVEEHLGRPLGDVLPDLAEQLDESLRGVLETRLSVVGLEATGWAPGTQWFERHYHVSCYPVQREDGELLGLGAVFLDHTMRKRQEQAASMVARSSELLARESDLDATLEEAVEIVIPAFADSCQLYVFATPGSEQRVVVGHVDESTGELFTEAERRWPLDLAGAREALAGGRAQRVADVTPEVRRQFAHDDDHLQFMDEHGARSALVAPLEARGEMIGVLVLNYTTRSGRRYRRTDPELAEELARRLAQAIDSARLKAETVRYQEQLAVLARVGELVTLELDKHVRMRRVVQDVVPGLADVCLLHLRDAEGCFKLEHFAVADGDLADAFGTFDRWPDIPADLPSPNRDACLTKEPVLLEEISSEYLRDYDENVGAEQGEAAPRLGARSLLCAPLLDEGGDAFGTITFAYGWSDRTYREDDVPVAKELARRAAASIQHAERFQRERATAETLQRSLLPQRVPTLPGVATAARYLPGGESERVGGDWYDAFALPDGRVLLAIGDVVGHGLHAASSAGLLRSAGQLAALDRLSPAMILDQLNHWLLVLPDAEMATVAVALYDPSTRVLQFASAGHPPALRLRRNGKTLYLGGALAPPLRASATTRFRERRVRLREDDVVLLYTDGLVERRGESIDLGLERLRRVLAGAPADLEQLSDHLLANMLPEEGPADDVALLVLRIFRPAATDLMDDPPLPTPRRARKGRWGGRFRRSRRLH